AIESTLSNLTAFLSGANLVHDVGYIDSGVNASLESLVMNEDIIGMVRQVGKGIKTDEDYLALKVIEEAGPGGEFVTKDHTYEHWREWFLPKLMDRSDWETWNNEGAKTMLDRVKDETQRILDTHEPEPIDDATRKGLQEIIDAAEKRHSK
ncbi:MAG: trimethylamine methyltransferase family protein, partial [Desulfobacterales bacterium]